MDYEKKYKEAIERAKKLGTFEMPLDPKRSIGEQIFPELCGLEDEIIIKELINFIKKANEYGGYALTTDEADRMLAWLEKLSKLNKQVWSEEELRELNAVRHLNPGLDSLYLKLKGE